MGGCGDVCGVVFGGEGGAGMSGGWSGRSAGMLCRARRWCVWVGVGRASVEGGCVWGFGGWNGGGWRASRFEGESWRSGASLWRVRCWCREVGMASLRVGGRLVVVCRRRRGCKGAGW